MESLSQRVESRWSGLRTAERAVAEYISGNPSAVLFNTASELAKTTGTSDATVVRTARALGYEGLPDLKRHVGIELTRTMDPSQRLEDTIAHTPRNGPLAAVLQEGAEQIEQLQTSVNAEEVDVAVDMLHAAGHVVTWGLGTSTVAAAYAASRLGRAGIAARHLDQAGFALANELITLRDGTCLLLFVPGRNHPDVGLLLTSAEELGIDTILVCNALGPDVRSRATHVVDLPRLLTKITSEVLSEILVTDMLASLLLFNYPDDARAARLRLTHYRSQLPN